MVLALDIAIAIFILLESANVLILYFVPDFKYANSMVYFNNWFKAKGDENDELFVRYLTNWVGNTKLIFISLLAVILFFGSEEIKVISVVVLIITIFMYFVRLHPLIKKLDNNGQITPKNHSKTLSATIIVFIVMFSASLAVYFVF